MVLGAIVTGIFLMVVVPVVLLMVVWVIVTVFRICMPEEEYLKDSPAMLRRQATHQGVHTPVGVREICEDQRRYIRHHLRQPEYHYETGTSAGIPFSWLEDLNQRRN